MDLRPRSHIHHYFPPTALSCHKLPTYVDAYKHYLWLKPCSDASAKKLTTEKIIFSPSHTQNIERHIRIVSQTLKNIVSPKLRDARINNIILTEKIDATIFFKT